MIGNTPVVNESNVFLKLEYFNPTGSHKDRTAYYMLKSAYEKELRNGGTVIEYTSGNTGISVAWASKMLGLKSIILVPEGTSVMKVKLIKLFGGEIVRVPPDVDGHEYAEKLATETGGIFLQQRKNKANYLAHYETTGPEILRQVKDFDVFVMGAGTGGTVYGVGKYLKEKRNMRIVMLMPKGSYAQEYLTGKKIEEKDREIMEGFTYHSLSKHIERAISEKIVDEIKWVSSEESIAGMKKLWTLGIPGGPTSGANYYYARRYQKSGLKVVTLVPDQISRYPHLLEELII